MDTVRDDRKSVTGPRDVKPTRPGSRLLNGDRAYAEIKRRILDNEMQAGAQFLELELAALLDMSRTPVREAMVRLAEEGMVEIRPRHGMRILPVSAADMREIYQILITLEATAAELAAEKGLTPNQLAKLTAAVADMDRAMDEDNLRDWAAADERFHLLLVEYCGNARLRGLVGTFWDQSHRARMATLTLRPKPVDSNKDHAAVIEAIARRDPEAARRIHREHRIRAGRTLVAILEDNGLTQL
jgi:DNA-binding GntR family transcriptional regulator